MCHNLIIKFIIKFGEEGIIQGSTCNFSQLKGRSSIIPADFAA